MIINDQIPLHAPLSKMIRDNYNKLSNVLERVSEENFFVPYIDGTGGKISAIDLIAFHIGWGSLLLSWYNNGIKGIPFTMPGEGFETWDYNGLARHFYEKYHYTEPAKAKKHLRDVVNKIIMVTEREYESGRLDKIGAWSWCTSTGKQWSLNNWVMVNTVAPYKKSRGLILNLLGIK